MSEAGRAPSLDAMPSAQPSPTILVAEDDPNDRTLMLAALAAAGATPPVQTFGNGTEVIQFLREICAKAATADVAWPRLLFLDLHLPQIDGCGVIAWIRRQKLLAGLHIVVVSGSGDSMDVKRAEALGANRILTKPPSVEVLREELTRSTAPFPLRKASATA